MNISQAKARLRQMPTLLRLFTIASLGVGLFSPLVLIPAGEHFSFDGSPITYKEFWACGIGYFVLGLGIVLLISAIGILNRLRWAKHSAALGLAAGMVTMSVMDSDSTVSSNVVGFGIEMVCMAFWPLYLELSPGVNKYFALEEPEPGTGDDC